MYFDALFKLGALVLLGGLLTTIYFYVSSRKVSPPEQAPSFVRYFGVAFLVGIFAYIVGTAAGIYFACSSPTSGNLCGVYGALGVGPLLSGLALVLYGLSWKSPSQASASVGAPVQRTAGWHTWTEHPLVRAIAGSRALALLFMARLPCSTVKAAQPRLPWSSASQGCTGVSWVGYRSGFATDVAPPAGGCRPKYSKQALATACPLVARPLSLPERSCVTNVVVSRPMQSTIKQEASA